MGQTILIIEDDIQNFQLMSNLANLEGYTVQHADNGEEGLQLVEQSPPCLILLDLRLPGMDGWNFATIMKKSTAFRHIPIIAVSVQTDHDDAAKAIGAGCDHYMPKPFRVNQLRQVIQEYAIC